MDGHEQNIFHVTEHQELYAQKLQACQQTQIMDLFLTKTTTQFLEYLEFPERL